MAAELKKMVVQANVFDLEQLAPQAGKAPFEAPVVAVVAVAGHLWPRHGCCCQSRRGPFCRVG